MPEVLLETVREVLERAHGHVEAQWCQESFFVYRITQDFVDAELAMHLDGLQLDGSPWIDGIQGRLGRIEGGHNVPKNTEIVGMCLAGCVLYSMDWTDTQWLETDDTTQSVIKHIVRAILDSAPENADDDTYERVTGFPRRWVERMTELQERRDTYTHHQFAITLRGYRIDVITSFNDVGVREKHEVLDVLDRAVKDVIARIEAGERTDDWTQA